MMKCVEMGGHFSTNIDMCPSDTTLLEEDPYMHKVMEVLYLYECDGQKGVQPNPESDQLEQPAELEPATVRTDHSDGR